MPDNTGQVQEEYLGKLSQLESKIAGDTFVASFSKNCEVLKSMCGLALVYENRMKQYTKEMKSILTDLKQAGGFRLDYALIGAPCSCQCHENDEASAQSSDGQNLKTSSTREAETQTEAQHTTNVAPPEGHQIGVGDAAQSAQEMCPAGAGGDYVYNEQYHMYFSQSTGYYWDPKTKLFYQPTTGTYYSYDEDTQSYTVVEPPGAACSKDRKDNKDRRRRSRSRDRRRRRSRSRSSREREHQQLQRRRRRSRSRQKKRLPSPSSPRARRGSREADRDDEGVGPTGSPASSRDQRRSPTRRAKRLERGADEGELLSEEEEEGSIEMAILSEDEDSNAVAHYPPCIRFVVKQSQQLPAHSVQMLPFPGGVLGAPLKSDLCVPDPGIGKRHCNIYFEAESQQYKVEQLDGNNSTKINGKPLKKGTKHDLVHMDRFELGEGTLLEVHLHDRKDTCGNCEPGLLQRRAELDAPLANVTAAGASSLSSEAQRRRNLKGLKKQYGLAEEPYIEPWLDGNPPYIDRAGERRARVGSDFPHELDAAPANPQVPMERSNKGFKMLQGMGWREGEGLGRSNQGGVQPVAIQKRSERVGLGTEDATTAQNDDGRGERWKRARARYDQIK